MRSEILVAGGGPAGAALASLLAREGRDVALIEREARPHDKVCGEFISGEAAGYLQALGLDPVRLGAVPIERVRLVAGGRTTEAPLPFTALSLSRRRLDEALLQLAVASGAQVRRGRRVKRLEAFEEGWRAELDGGETAVADAAFLATGKHDLKDLKRPAGLHRDLVGFKMHLRLHPRQAALLDGASSCTCSPAAMRGWSPSRRAWPTCAWWSPGGTWRAGRLGRRCWRPSRPTARCWRSGCGRRTPCGQSRWRSPRSPTATSPRRRTACGGSATRRR